MIDVSERVLRLAGIIGGILLAAFASTQGIDGVLMGMAGALIGFGVGIGLKAITHGKDETST